uniref:Galactokinase n=1 Tax=Polytomella parva TaxID=51329 RepID=A0A7S0UU43_9CHLO|mmetsp:Transcript_17948/g.32772  ORF Transcript_17948/g.32772 Transcript_17948/m.32772 type:complete len:543 (+) Transcript_17948:39-1667(+)
MTDVLVPRCNSIESFCKEYSGDKGRIDEIIAKFKELYGEVPDAFVRAPGRVNLIGEHIDYMDYSVLPMAIRQDTVIAVRRGTDKLRIASLDPRNRYAPMEFDIDPSQTVNIKTHYWGNYFLTAYKEVFATLAAKGQSVTPCGLDLLIQGQVPAGSGLSSSAAFSCASALAVLSAHGLTSALTKGEIADLATRSERNVGVSSGGMDQAASMMGSAGLALHISFHGGLGVEYVQLPSTAASTSTSTCTSTSAAGGTFIVMHSLAVANKIEGPEKRYNLRVVECRLACLLLLKGLHLFTPENCRSVKTLRQIQELAGILDPSAMLTLVDEHIRTAPYSASEVLAELDLASLEADVFGAEDFMAARVLKVAREDGYLFPVHRRARHVYSEAARVLEFSRVCHAGQGEKSEKEESKNDSNQNASTTTPAVTITTTTAEQLSALGALMTASHWSCAKDYECSCAELDELVNLALSGEARALGARLTGAGWGGCAVALVRDEQVEAFLEKMRSGFYQKRIDQGVLENERVGEVLFATKPSGGACFIDAN